MKRITNYLIALAVAAFTFTSCEDVPSPFGSIVAPEKGETIVVTPTGTGTEADPYNVAAVLEYLSGLGADTQSDKEVYIKGIVSEVQEVDVTGSYGNATYYISDDADGKANKFMIYRGFGLGGKKFNEGATPVKAGDNVIIKSKVVLYKGNTPETVSNNCIIVELNGVKDGGSGGDTPTPTPGEAKGTGTQADPFNAAGANKYIASLAADTESANDIYIKGKIVKFANNGEFNAQYGNASFYISEDGKESSEQFYVFRTLYLGNVKYTEGAQPKVGDEVVICGKVVNYKGNTPETVANKSYIYSLNGQTSGGGSDTPAGNNDGSLEKPFTPAEANAFIATLAADTNTDKDYYIKGKIIEITEKNQFNTQYGNCTFYISDDGTDKDGKFYVFRTLYLGNVKYTEGTLPKAGDEVVICGKLVNYKGNTPETVANQSYIYSLNGKTSADGGGGGSEATAGTLEKPFTPAEANAFVATLSADTNTDKDYYVKGKIIEITEKNQFNTQYGNCTFYISDDGTDKDAKFYVFRTLYLGNVKYTEGTLPKAGDEVVICGKFVNYKGNTPETVANQSYIYSLNGKTK
jgi:exonuclease VII large subunit